MKLIKESHVDHGLTAAQLAHVLLMFEKRDAFFIETIKLPFDLGYAPCSLFGPVMGDPPIPSVITEMRVRKGRKHASRIITKREPIGTDYFKLAERYINSKRESQFLTVIAGPHGEDPCVLYTVFGGPLAPKEVGEANADLEAALAAMQRSEGSERSVEAARETLSKSIEFWAEHALVEV